MYFGFDPAKFTLNSPIFTGAPTSPTPPLHNNTDRIATMAALRAELLALGDAEYNAIFGKSLSASGYQKLPSGLIIQWGQTSHTGESTAWTFPIAFPTACQSVLCNMKTDNGAAIVMSNTNSQAFGSSAISGINTTGTHNYNWFAIGY